MLRPVVDALRLNRIAHPVWAALWPKDSSNLVRARQNGRVWWLDAEVALRGEFQEMETILWLRSVIKPGMTVIDVGANVGQMTLEMAQLVGPTGRVVAIEPGLGNLNLLRRHIEANSFAERVTVIDAACAALHGGEMKLLLHGSEEESVGSGFQLMQPGILPISRLHEIQPATTIVRAVSIDGLCNELAMQPDIIKIDVEGAELEVLRGSVAILSKYRPQLRLAFHPFAFVAPYDVQQSIVALLASCGINSHENSTPIWELDEYNFSP
jgi:FkbM family methyltransferase